MTFLMLPGHILFPEWFFQALERMKYITLLNILSRLIFTVSIFIFIQNSSQYWIQPLLTSLGYIFSGVIAAYYIFFRWRYRLLKPDMRSIWIALKSSSDVFINEIFPNFYNSLSVIILGFFWGPSANGILDVGTKFSSLGIQLNRVVSRTFFPLLSREIHYHKYLRYIQLSSAAFLALILTIFAPQIIDVFYTSNFADAAVAIRILGISIFFVALSNVYGTNYLIIQGCERQLRNATCLASIIGFVLAIPLVYKFSYIGAALTIGITRMLLGLIIYVQAYKLKKTTQ